MWAIRKAVWNKIATLKFGANKPVRIPVPQDDARVLKAVSLASLYPRIPIANAVVGDHVPTDEASGLKSGFYDVQVGLYGGLSPMEPGLPAIDADPHKALDDAYTAAHRKCFPTPVLPPEYQGPVDLGSLAVAGPYACYVERAPEGGFQWDLRRLARHPHHDGLRSLGVRVLFRVNAAARRLEAARIESELGASVPGDSSWALSTRLALCAATTDVSIVRHFNGVHLAAGGPLAIATRSCLPAAHPLRRLLWPHMFGTQFSNDLITKGQLSPGGEFDSIFSFTHQGMCALFTETWAAYDITVLDPHRDAERRGITGAGFDTPALANRAAHFDVMHAHARRYLTLYYDSDAAVSGDRAVAAWADALQRTVPGGIRALVGDALTVASLARLVAAFIYMGTVEHELLGTGLWNYQMWTHVQPVRVYRSGQREPLDVYQRLVNANFNLNVHRAQLLQDFGYLALDPKGAEAFAQFKRDLEDLQRKIEAEPAALWKVSPAILEANINA
ncbi:MAG TPA: lipoxygenase family protein [Myxococcaceae bacterium]|nr:lipoxygenase family protein [Myxococcaceae bacterium]